MLKDVKEESIECIKAKSTLNMAGFTLLISP